MFLPFLAASIVGLSLIKLGAMSVQIGVLTLALKAALAAIAFIALLAALLLRQGRRKVS